MNNSFKISLLFLMLGPLVSGQEHSLSPYFEVISEQMEKGSFPLLHTSAEVQVAGVIAEVQVEQVYHNAGVHPMEAIYIFPGSTRAAVHGMEMHIGGRKIVAQIKEKKKARELYEKAQQEGKRASLLEQQRPNVFQMNVANIMPGDTIRTILKYTELLLPEKGIYELVYPTVVGPRYTGEEAPQILAAIKEPEGIPYSKAGEEPTYSFDFNLNLKGGMPLQQVESPSHKIKTEWLGKESVAIALHPSEKMGGNRDFILRYRLGGEGLQTGMLLFEGEEENNFLLMVQPPERIAQEEITPREYIFIVDVSGSMNGFPLDLSKKMMGDLLGGLRPDDRFNVMAFASQAGFLSEESIPVNASNIEFALSNLKKLSGSGGTRLLNALEKAMAVPKQDGFSRSFVILTDGYISVEPEAFAYIDRHLGEANFFTFGIGKSVNRHLIEGMARVGSGVPFVVTNESEGAAIADRFRKYIEAPLLTNIGVDFDGFDAYDVLPTRFPDLMGERPLLIFGKYKNKAKGKVIIKGNGGRGKFQEKVAVEKYIADPAQQALPYLWARKKIQYLNDYALTGKHDDSNADRILQLGLKYHLLTNYTSFVAVDDLIVNPGGKGEKVEQVLPMPEGVPNSSIGYEAHQIIRLKREHGMAAYGIRSTPAPQTYENAQSLSVPPPPPTLEPEEIFSTVERMPRFSGCEGEATEQDRKVCSDQKLLEFLYGNIKVEDANDWLNRIIVSFVVKKDGSIAEPKIIRGDNAVANAEVIRVIKLMPKWVPGMQREKAVDVRFNLPVRIKPE